MHRTRRVILPWGRLGDGVSLIGGRGRGIFIYSQKEDSRGLQTGDQVLKVRNLITSTFLNTKLLTNELNFSTHCSNSPKWYAQ